MVNKGENLAIIYDDVELALGALGTKDTIKADSKIDAARSNGYRVMKTEYWADVKGHTGTEGPIMVGMSFGMDASGVETTIEADPQSSTEDFLAGDTKNPVFPLFMVRAEETSTNDSGFGHHGTITPKWSSPEGRSVNWWAYNMDSSALTTGTTVHIFAKHYGVWLRD